MICWQIQRNFRWQQGSLICAAAAWRITLILVHEAQDIKRILSGY